MDLIQYLKTDDEMKNLRAKWKETFVTPFPPYNWDEYNGIEDYKEKIRNKLKNGAVALRCGSFVFLSNTKRRASKSPAFVV